MVADWGSADLSRSDELQFAAQVVRQGPSRRAFLQPVRSGRNYNCNFRTSRTGSLHPLSQNKTPYIGNGDLVFSSLCVFGLF